MGWWIDGLMWSLGGLGIPLRGANWGKREPNGAQIEGKRTKRERKGSKNGYQIGPKIDFGSQWVLGKDLWGAGGSKVKEWRGSGGQKSKSGGGGWEATV